MNQSIFKTLLWEASIIKDILWKQSVILLILKKVGVIALVGILYLFIFRKFQIGIPCVFNKITGLKCPGCGMTHAIAEISKGNFKDAFTYNALSLTILPISVIYMLYRTVHEEKQEGKEFYIWEYGLMIVLLAITIVYTYSRNYL